MENYKLLFHRTLKEKNDVKATAKKERNLHSPPRQNDQVESEISDDEIKSYLKYREKFENLHPFQKEIILNFFREKNGRDYSMEFKQFCYVLYNKSPREYKLLETLLPFPCYKTIHNNFENDISNYNEYITNVDSCIEILKQKEIGIEGDFIPCVLSIDAFTTTIFKKQEIKDNNHCFIFNMQPFDTSIKSFILHLEPSGKGNGSKEIDEITNKILKIPSKFKILFISVDGDLHYDNFFKKQFDRLINLYKNGGLENVFDHLFDNGPIYISDFLHIDKNMRSRLLNNKIIINPFIPQKSINTFCINQLIDAKDALFDRSSIGKMRDAYPLQLFTIKNSLVLLNQYTKESFFYFVLFSLWSEAQLNQEIDPETRVYLINTLIDIFVQLYDEYSKTLPQNVSMKNSPYCSQLFLTYIKIQRIIPTLIAESFSIQKHCENLGIDRLGSHPCENRIGNIRCECQGNHSFENVLATTTRHEYLKGALKCLSLKEERPTRLNMGGCKTSMGNVRFNFSIDHITFANLIMKIGYYQNANEEETDFIFNKLKEFITEAPYNHAFNISTNSNVSILNRIYSSKEIKNDYSPYFKQILWSSSENKLITQMILTGNEFSIYSTLKWIPQKVLHQKIYQEKQKLYYRPLDRTEFLNVQQYIERKISIEQLLSLCKWRTKESLEFLAKQL